MAQTRNQTNNQHQHNNHPQNPPTYAEMFPLPRNSGVAHNVPGTSASSIVSVSNSDSSISSFDTNTHPLYLHDNDQLSMILISKKLLGTKNFVPWKRSLQIALSAKNKLVIVNGSFEEPDQTSPLFPQWQWENDMVISWILNTVCDEISNNMNNVHSAKAVWDELNERYASISGHKIFEVQKELFKLEQGTSSVETYFHKLKGLWDELSTL